jgi:hypothetical protein
MRNIFGEVEDPEGLRLDNFRINRFSLNQFQFLTTFVA